MSPEGIVVIDKPAGMTSHDVVARVRKSLNVKRVGHGGTLDPDATGILVVGVGRAARLLSYAQAAPKTYVAGGRLGRETTTQDASGETVSEREVEVTRAQLEEASSRFRGRLDQIPPMVSAVKVKGERLYKKALRGEEIEREPRRIEVYSLEVMSYDAPDFTIEVSCSAGTYVRTLVHDIGEELGCGAHLTELRRVAAGGFRESDAVALDEVSIGSLRPPLEIVSHLPRVDVSSDAAALVRNGRRLEDPHPGGVDEDVAIVSEGELLAVYKRRGPELVPERVVAS